MPPFPGEDRLLTLFADVHYYFTIPTPNPVYHRFDKGSYLYVYHDAVRGSARLEIANNPGTNEQDAFNGVLDNVHIVHSTRFPTLCTMTVGSQVENSPVSAHNSDGSQEQWLLPFTDPRGQSKRSLRLHTLDIYFWTSEDADQFLDAAERVLPQQLESDRQAQSEVVEEPAVSTVVEKLENVAITDPAYQNGQTKDSRSEPAQTVQEAPKEEQTDYTPLAYNPAAPAAPEPIKHREKTPPPEDADGGTGLIAAAVADHHPQYYPSTPAASGFSQPPNYTASSQFNSPSPSRSLSISSNLPGPPVYTALPVASPPPTQAGGMSFAPPPPNPNAHLFSRDSYDSQQSQTLPQQVQTPQPQQQPPPPTPSQPQQHAHHSHHPQYQDYLQNQGHASQDIRVAIGGYSNYSYAQHNQNQYGQLATEYDIHNHVYRPTEAELKNPRFSNETPKPRGNKIEKGMVRVDSKVNGFLKRIERRIG
ncbi:hypothetical protein UA08_08141 [Talaromyces atroroseus]|uniref:RNA recognition motif-containing protein n=1 Tax=Talaromyces atroroseus TaxID=1441469 RepID=A0A225AM26_TALAT|nr:hypothetical protein UA08_08141 [Talaromyces atroroseus]OKL56619.1 hypothetical protein UA08_08141 [Talaromyces atroroseus]